MTSDLKISNGLKRLIAQAIDFALVFLTTIVAIVLLKVPSPLFKWILLWTYLAYATLMDCYYQGTVGKLYLKMKVVTTSNRSRLLTSFYRNFIKVLFGALFFDIILILLFVGHLGFHNSISSCKVVDTEAKNPQLVL